MTNFGQNIKLGKYWKSRDFCKIPSQKIVNLRFSLFISNSDFKRTQQIQSKKT